MSKTREAVVNLAASWLGKNERDGSYREIIDIYNSYKGTLPRRTPMQYDWAWCACTWSALAIKLGYTDIMPIEISCYYIIENAKAMGVWVEQDSYIPKQGDAVLYDWDDSGIGDCTGGADHIGVVVSVNKEAGTFTVIEGNMNKAVNGYDGVAKRKMHIDGRYIRGFICPKYDEEIKDTNKTEFSGIDVSTWQNDIDWSKVKNEGIDFAMIRLGYGTKKVNGSCSLDNMFEKNVSEARSVGIQLGCYFYSYATTPEAAKKEAEFVINILKDYKDVFTYPVAFDIEDSTTLIIPKETNTEIVKVFCDTVAAAGHYVAVYSYLNWFKGYVNDNELQYIDHWVAQWSDELTYKGNVTMWQKSSEGLVSGVKGYVDRDISFVDYPSIIKKQDAEEPKKTKTIDEIAKEVIDGLWGNGADRKNKLTEAGYVYSDVQNRVNEILNGDSVKKTEEVVQTTETKSITARNAAKKFDKTVAGTYVTTANLYMRHGAGTNNEAITLIPKGTKVKCYGYYTTNILVKWLYIQVTLNGVLYSGFSSSLYLKKQ